MKTKRKNVRKGRIRSGYCINPEIGGAFKYPQGTSKFQPIYHHDVKYRILSNVPPNNIKLINVSNYAESYLFSINTPTEINTIFDRDIIPLNIFDENSTATLNPGKYILKLYYAKFKLSERSQEYLLELSDNDLIPKIYYIDRNMIIMKFIESVDVLKLLKEEKYRSLHKKFDTGLAFKKYLLQKVNEELYKWHKLKFTHGDFAERNILLTPQGKVYLIDPKEKPQKDDYTDDKLKFAEFVLKLDE